jgi:hypothetical protein
MITVGGVDTYYDYDDGQWKYRRLGGGPVRPGRSGSNQDPQLIPAPDPEVTTREPDRALAGQAAQVVARPVEPPLR